MTVLLEAVRALAPEIIARTEEFEAVRRMPNDLALKIADAGLFKMLVPKAYGGGETTPLAFAETTEALARLDASVGWCVMIAASTGMTAAYLPPEDARDIFNDSRVITGGAFAPSGRAVVDGDDLVVNGHWSWISGGQNCTWLLGGCVIEVDGVVQRLANGAPDHRMVFWPANNAQLHDTWHVSGLKGTGSLDMSVEGLIAPKRRSVSLITDQPRIRSPLYAFPPFALLAIGVASVALGNARGAIDALVKLANAKKPQGSGRVLAERAHAQSETAKAEAALSAARAFMMETIRAAMDDAMFDRAFSLESKARLRLAATHAVRTGADVCRAMYDLGGGASVYSANALQRRFRDGATATQHMLVQHATYELAGRVLLGLETDASTL